MKGKIVLFDFILLVTLIMVSILISSCSTQVVLPGLCYNDRDGTYLCPETDPEAIVPEPLPPTEHQKLWKDCEPFLNHPEPAWTNCILIA